MRIAAVCALVVMTPLVLLGCAETRFFLKDNSLGFVLGPYYGRSGEVMGAERQDSHTVIDPSVSELQMMERLRVTVVSVGFEHKTLADVLSILSKDLRELDDPITLSFEFDDSWSKPVRPYDPVLDGGEDEFDPDDLLPVRPLVSLWLDDEPLLSYFEMIELLSNSRFFIRVVNDEVHLRISHHDGTH